MRSLLQLQYEGVLVAKGVCQQNAIGFGLRLALARGGHRISPMGRDARLEVFRPSHVGTTIDLEVEAALRLEPLPANRLTCRISDGLRADTVARQDSRLGRLEHPRCWIHDERWGGGGRRAWRWRDRRLG